MTVTDRDKSVPELVARDRAEPDAPAFAVPAAVNLLPVAGLSTGQSLRRRLDADEPDPLGGAAIPGDVIGALRRQRGGGKPLPEHFQRAGGESLGVDLSPVRVHTGPEAARLARSVQASAFTYGNDIFFSAGAYRPGDADGQRLISHELGHIGQSSGTAGGVIGRADDPAEAEADRAGAGVLTALRRQAARVGPPAVGSGTAAEVGADRSGTVLRSLAASAAVIRRAYTAEERPAILSLAQVGNSEQRVDELSAFNWSRAATVALAQRQPPPTYDQLLAIMGRFTAAQTDELAAVPLTWVDMATLAGLGWQANDLIVLADSGWAGADILALAQAPLHRGPHERAVLAAMDLGGDLPTVEQLEAVDRFSLDQVMGIIASPENQPFDSWDLFIHPRHPWLEDQIHALTEVGVHRGVKADRNGHEDPVFTCWQWATRGLDVPPISIDLANRYFSYRTNYPDVFGEVMDHAHAREQALSGLADDNPRRDEIHAAERAYLNDRQAQLQGIITAWINGAGDGNARNGAAQRAIMEMQLTDAGFDVLPPGTAARWYICMHERQNNVSWEHWWIKTRSGDVIETFPNATLNFHRFDFNMGNLDIDFRHEVPVRDLLPAQKQIIKREVARQHLDFTDDLP